MEIMMEIIYIEENPFAVTFPKMKKVAMEEFAKVVVPKLGGGMFGTRPHAIRKHVPIADVVLNQLSIADRVELSQDSGGDVSMTICFDPKIAKGQKDFRFSDTQLETIGSLGAEVQEHIPTSKCGSGAIHFGCLKNEFAVSEIVDLSKFPKPIRELHDVVVSVLNPMAAKHGGSYEIVNIHPDQTAWADIPDGEKKYLIEGKQNAVFDLVLFGACGGCTSFQWTYGTAPAKVAEKLKEVNANLSVQLRSVRPSELEEHKPGKRLIFRRPQLLAA